MKQLPFINPFMEHSDAPAIFSDVGGVYWTYADLCSMARVWQAKIAGPPALIFVYARNRPETVAALIGFIAGGHTVALLDPALPKVRRQLIEAEYKPNVLVSALDEDCPYKLEVAADRVSKINPLNAVLLSTSGSTGAPKFVRLSQNGLEHNANAIADVLDIRAGEVGAAHLPLHYSYGLSVVTSHLARGASLWITELGFVQSAFWKAMTDVRVAHLPGVPYHYQMLLRLGLNRAPLDYVRVMTQAGGFLNTTSRQELWSHMDAKRGRFHVLYGQTEAGPRITTLAHDEFSFAPASVGRCLPGGILKIEDVNGRALGPNLDGRVIYTGPNVMLGYAERKSDLTIGDAMGGRLETGDIGHVDSTGRLYLVGRTSDFVKVLGLRINTEDLVARLSSIAPAFVIARDDQLHIAFEASCADIEKRMRQAIADTTTLPLSSIVFHPVDALPRTSRGKVDGAVLGEMI